MRQPWEQEPDAWKGKSETAEKWERLVVALRKATAAFQRFGAAVAAWEYRHVAAEISKRTPVAPAPIYRALRAGFTAGQVEVAIDNATANGIDPASFWQLLWGRAVENEWGPVTEPVTPHGVHRKAHGLSGHES